MPPAPWRLFGSKSFFRLWLAQFVSSLGDWIGLIAILAIAARVSNNSGAAVSLVMVTRVVPGFFLGTVGGVIIDRFDRRKVMVLLRHRPRLPARRACRSWRACPGWC